MAEVTLEVNRREQTGKEVAKKLRREGKVPAVVYGGHREPVAIAVDRKAVSELVQKSEHGIRSVFLLKMAGSDQQRHAMIKDLTIDPISRKMTHIDFVRVVMDEVVRVTVPVHVSGTAAGVKEGGLLDFQVRELHVECLPNAIPDSIEVDVAPLGSHDYFRIKDLKLPEGVKVLDDPERVVVGVTHARAEVTDATAEGAAGTAEPEVIKKGKPDEEKK
ncbi:MAG: 50S ribosomal protein L25 [Acidobacteria bacterium]|nr:50S ribosomal protein L25 [Acidobacteriota bacterium]MBV9478738.1 50S ribosomal protein L25 [Acidobacteriota bacterium]